MKNKSVQNQGNAALILLILVAIVGGVGAITYFNGKSQTNVQALPSLPPVSDRTNPEPVTGYEIVINKVDPGKTVTVDSVNLTTKSQVAIVKDGKTQIILGKSAILDVGSHKNITINLNTAIKDGDVVFVRLLDTKGQVIMGENKTNIEVMKSVGMVMGHYENEY